MNEVSSMSEEQSVLNTFSFSVQAVDGEVLPSPVFRLVLSVAYGSALGKLQKGYYVSVNNSNYFITKESVDVETIDKAQKVFAFLQKTQVPFTVNIRCPKTCSGYQYIQTFDVNTDSYLYTLEAFKVFKGLWREIEGTLYQNKSPEIAKFSDGKLDWVAELKPEHKLSFTQGSNISATLFATQGHLQVYKLAYDDVFAIPYYLYTSKKVKIFNHSIERDVVVISLGLERKIVKVLSTETQITSEDHEPVNLPQGEYLLFHPIPTNTVD